MACALGAQHTLASEQQAPQHTEVSVPPLLRPDCFLTRPRPACLQC